MRKAYFSLILVVVIVVVVALVAIFYTAIGSSKYGIIKGKIYDELSGDPVKGVRIVADGRSTVLYRSTSYELTHIPPGEYTLQASPPSGWVKFTKTVKVKPGENKLNIPLKGDKIPDLKEIICFSDSRKDGITIEIRYADSKGIGMTDFPELPIKVDITIWERVGKEKHYKKGKKLFEGPIKHYWDSSAYLAKNKGFIPWSEIPVKLEDKKWGIMEIRVHLKQGDFKDTIEDVQLFPVKEEYQ